MTHPGNNDRCSRYFFSFVIRKSGYDENRILFHISYPQ